MPDSTPPDRLELHPHVAITRATPDDGHYFFGYYDKCPWDAGGRRLLAMRADFFDRPPRPGEELAVGMIDLNRPQRFIELDRTEAWCWQQGTMLQWLGNGEAEIIYNIFDGREYRSVIRDVEGGYTRMLPRPIYAVSQDGRQAVTLDFDRVHRLRPGYGYVAFEDRTADQAAPADTGIHWLDLTTGHSKLIASLAWAASHQPRDTMDGAHHWFNHLTFNPAGSRFAFLHRWKVDTRPWMTRFYTAGNDGSQPHLLRDDGMTSHYGWRDNQSILAWSRTAARGDHYYLIDDETGDDDLLGADVLTQDGHCTYSPDLQWVLTDTYWDDQNRRTLLLYHVPSGRRIDLGKFYSPRNLPVECRCDLHPRFNRDGTQVCIDSLHEGFRGVYLLDVSKIVRG